MAQPMNIDDEIQVLWEGTPVPVDDECEVLWEGTPEPAPCGICLVGVPRVSKMFVPVGKCPNGHKFHDQCITRWIMEQENEQRPFYDSRYQYTCPVCRGRLSNTKGLTRNSVQIYERFRFCEFVMNAEKRGDMPPRLVDFLKENCEYVFGAPFETVRFGPDFFRSWPEYDANKLGLVFWDFASDDELMDLANFISGRHACGWECEDVLCFMQKYYLRVSS